MDAIAGCQPAPPATGAPQTKDRSIMCLSLCRRFSTNVSGGCCIKSINIHVSLSRAMAKEYSGSHCSP
ncbi:MAG: hypothetical protein LBF64_00370, partial [Oscillospiraceae bacterium]|nr:hypothetical protein [Oscillospiraceae bacterium]